MADGSRFTLDRVIPILMNFRFLRHHNHYHWGDIITSVTHARIISSQKINGLCGHHKSGYKWRCYQCRTNNQNQTTKSGKYELKIWSCSRFSFGNKPYLLWTMLNSFLWLHQSKSTVFQQHQLLNRWCIGLWGLSLYAHKGFETLLREKDKQLQIFFYNSKTLITMDFTKLD